MKRRKAFVLVLTIWAGHIYTWLLIRPLHQRSIITLPIIKMPIFLLTSQTVKQLCLGHNCPMNMSHSAIPLEWLLGLHFKIAWFMSFFTLPRIQFLFSQPRYDAGIYWFWWVPKGFTMFPHGESSVLIKCMGSKSILPELNSCLFHLLSVGHQTNYLSLCQCCWFVKWINWWYLSHRLVVMIKQILLKYLKYTWKVAKF